MSITFHKRIYPSISYFLDFVMEIPLLDLIDILNHINTIMSLIWPNLSFDINFFPIIIYFRLITFIQSILTIREAIQDLINLLSPSLSLMQFLYKLLRLSIYSMRYQSHNIRLHIMSALNLEMSSKFDYSFLGLIEFARVTVSFVVVFILSY